jgi:hypothetical protein
MDHVKIKMEIVGDNLSFTDKERIINEELGAFNKWISLECKASPLIPYELAILKTYLVAKIIGTKKK